MSAHAVALPDRFVDRLNRASAKKRFYPFDPEVIDWSVPITDEYLYMPETLTFLHGSPVWERLSFQDRSFVTRWEITQMMRNAGFGEHLLNQGALALMWRIDQHEPSWRYLLHEVAEECQHMAMFNAWVVRNADIRTIGASDARVIRGLVPFLSRLAPRIASRRPELFWVYVLLFEAVGDDVFQQLARDPGPIHPILRRLGRVHVAEEARHIAFALEWLERGIPTLSRAERRALRRWSGAGLAALARMPRLFPLVYGRQLEPYLTRDEFRQAVRSEAGRQRHRERVREVAERLHAVGAISTDAVRR